jgi:16S rRNA (cytosine967-C5)-methyltransferase
VSPKAVQGLVKIQGQVLKTASESVKTGGKICYSTCSIQKDENSGLIRDFLAENDTFTLESEQLTLPSTDGFDCDGGYAAILTRE